MDDLVLRDVSFSYKKGNWSLTNVNVAIDQGSFVSCIGDNGTGKSTLLQILAGLLHPDAGTRTQAEVSLSYVPSDATELLLPWYEVGQNLAFYATSGEHLDLKRLPRVEEQVRRFWSAIHFVETNAMSRRVYELSSGQRAIVALSCALLKEPKILILDEVFANLSRNWLDGVLKELRANTRTVVQTSHNLDSVVSDSDRVLRVANGHVETIQQ